MQTINFDGQNLATGTLVSNQFDDVEFSTSSEFGLMLFDTNNITGKDSDLASTDLDNVLIISEDGDSNDPDDNSAGGTINLEFDNLVSINSIGLLDIDESGSAISFFDENSNLIETVEIDNLGDNSFQKLDLDINSVASLDLNLAGSGAVTEIDFTSNPTADYSNIYIFGDSLSDTGNLFNTTSFLQDFPDTSALGIPVLPPSPPYFEGRFSNGQIWIESLADEFGIDLTPSSELSVVTPGSDIVSPVTIIDGNPTVSPFFNGEIGDLSINFSYGTATTGANGIEELGGVVPGMERQVDFFVGDLLQAEQAADPDALYILWGGSNDYLVPNADPEQTVNNIETEIKSLFDVGARNFLVANLPDLGRTSNADNPDLSTSPAQLSELTETHNLLLDSTTDELNDSLTGADITVLDVNSLFDDILANPAEFDFTNVTEPFLDPVTFTPTAGTNPDDYLFFDTIHPTEAAHALVSDLALDTLAIDAEF